ncbi:conserved hypothetical protein [Vibrio nigripulchritudo SO65]|uniref:hypothetical protein n=1 Tax=Vibrio nigripulchritudo TaxID=28173 RepID=UPI0003B197FD|nr:hypothetical protein [Vibrio nigripulchritudo]CCN32890.1 conserved hypothetical protein [Vibrio nigripulchritudo AM115]CCN40422.1 conserved hypothetical protein [Vibrio nigripulchritudo FTn2]CCN65303.1 conserved hypothetical protein [Vibrio nigripulchritudo POn4]CCN77278.1 conserved hypothetical protein [Vibrio nigripulchritudo SO65]
MAQVMHIETMAAPGSMGKKAYALNFKGLIAHLLDILFVESKAEPKYNVGQLSPYLQRDIGLNR